MPSNINKVHVKIPYTLETTAVNAIEVASISLDATYSNTLATNSDVIGDMTRLYRYFRVRRARVDVRFGTNFTAPDGEAVLCFLAVEGAPQNLTDVETDRLKPVVIHENGNQVSNFLNVNDFTQATEWKLCDSTTGSDEYQNYGSFYLVSDLAEPFTTGQKFLVILEVDIEFKVLTDSEVYMKSMEKKAKEKFLKDHPELKTLVSSLEDDGENKS